MNAPGFIRLSAFLLTLLIPGLSLQAHAAQVGQVVVEEAHVFQYPQAGSKVIGNLKKGETLPVSNLPTEGFYKAKLSNGEMGWLSGNDIHAGALPAVKPSAKCLGFSKALSS